MIRFTIVPDISPPPFSALRETSRMAPTAKARQGIADGYPQGRKAGLPQGGRTGPSSLRRGQTNSIRRQRLGDWQGEPKRLHRRTLFLRNKTWRARVLLETIIACKQNHVTLGLRQHFTGRGDESSSDLCVGKR